MADAVEFRASDLKRIGPVFDAAQSAPVVITRHSTRFVLVEEGRFRRMLVEAADPRPKTLEDLVTGYDKADVKARLGAWMADAPAGREAL